MEHPLQTASAADASALSLCRRYEVFINHRGPDVKDTFAQHLHTELTEKGLHVFVDKHEMKPGKAVPSQIKAALQKAYVHIAIFSPTYAESDWCLHELLLIMESVKSGQATILPVFYNVKHSDLRYGGPYAKALDKQEEQKRYDRQTIQKWKDALNDVPVQAGFELQACKGGEVELLRKVVQGVLNIVPKPQFDVAKYPTGLERKLRDFERNVLSQQEEEPREARVVGIIGPGGVGKTTFVQYFFNSKASEYDKSSLLLNVKAHGESLNILQGKLIADLKDLKIKINRDQGIAILKRHLLYCHALIILDDVDSIAQLDAFLQIKDVLDPKSLIVVTSRNRHVLESANFAQSSIYRLTGLDEFQSKELFCRHAFGDRPHPPDEFEILVKRVLKVCDGMPLSLTVLGAHLCNQDKLDWEDQLQGLPQTLPTQIKDSLLISYNSLTHQEKQIFLDIAIYAVGKDKDTWIRIWRESGWAGRVAFKNLWKKCLVEVDGENRIRMHDNLIDLGKSICSDSGHPESVPLRLWDVTVKDINDLLLKQRNHHQSSAEQAVRGIRMDPQSGDEEQLRLKSQTQLAGIKELQLLQAEGYFAEHLLTLVQPTKLIWFSWNKCPLLSLPPSILLQGLKVLEVAGGKLERLWESNTQASLQLQELNIDAPFLEFPRALGPIKQLEKIVVEYSVDEGAHLTTLPEELGIELSCLKHLKFKRCFRLQSIPESLGNLTKLQHIDFSGCKSLNKLPDSLGKLINLQNMKLSDCECLNELPDCLENLVNLHHINLSGCKSLKEFPDSLENFRELQHLDLSKCERLELLPNSFRNLTKLQYINLSECKSLAEVPNTFGHLTNLRHVDLSRCESLGALPDCFDNLKRIEHIDLSGCESLDGLPDSFKHLRNLQHISLSGCIFLKELPDCISRNLQHINLSGCKRLTKLPDSSDFLTHIPDINLSCCINLNELPNSFVNLIHLQHLNLERCESLKTLPDLFGKLSNLQHINLKQCKSLKKLPDSFGMLTNLQYIDLQRCSMLETLPDSFGNLINLKSINLFSCESLKMIPNSFGNLVQLRRVDLRDCCSLTISSEPLSTVAELYLGNNLTHELPSDVGCLRKLETLLIEDPLMEGFPPSLDELTNLQELLLVECQKLQCLPESVGRLAQLRLLEIRNCGIRSLPRDLMKLNNLKRLEVSNCPLHQLPFTKVEGERETTEGQIASSDLDASLDTGILKLEELHLELIEISEVSFPPRVCPRLRLLEIKSCNGIVEIGALPTTLRTLVLKRCGALRKIGGLSGLANLESVDMTDCNNIEAKESPGFETLMKFSKVVGRPLHTQVGQEEELRCLEFVTLILEVTRTWINSCTEGFCHLFRPS